MAEYKRHLVLTELALGFKDQELIGDTLFPRIEIDDDEAMIPKGNSDYMVLYDLERAEGAHSNRILKGKDSSFLVKLKEFDAETPIDWKKKNLIKNEDGGFKAEDEVRVLSEKKAATEFIMRSIALTREYKAASLAQDVNNYGSNNKLILSSAGDRFDNAASDVLGMFMDARVALLNSAGVEANTAVMDFATYAALIQHPQIKALLGSNERKIINQDTLKDLLGLATLKVGKAVVTDALLKSRVKLWGSNLILSYIAPRQNRNLYEPNYGLTLIDRRPTSTYADEYDEPGSKFGLVRVTETREVVLADASAGYIINGTIA